MANSINSVKTIATPPGASVLIDQAARLLNVSRRTIYNRIRDGRLRTLRTLGGSQRVLIDSLNEGGRPTRTYSPSDASLPIHPGTHS